MFPWKLIKKKKKVPVKKRPVVCDRVIMEIKAQRGEVKVQLTDFSERLRKMELRQKEASMQLDEISSIIQDGGESNDPLLEAVIALSAQIEDFYRYTARDITTPLFEQATMMWNATKAACLAADFEMIDDTHVLFDFNCHETAGCASDETVPTGYVLHTLQCGYRYKGTVIKRAAVIVNKTEAKI